MSALHDSTARLGHIPKAHGNAPMALASSHLHTALVSSVASDQKGTHLLTASWDTLIGLWDTTIHEFDEVIAEDASDDHKK